MTHLHLVRDRPHEKLVGQTVGKPITLLHLRVPIPIDVTIPLPQPATGVGLWSRTLLEERFVYDAG
jgi:hypothetical protein